MSPTTVVIPFPDSPESAPAATYEIEMQRRNTEAYIDSDPSDIQFKPRQYLDDGQGGLEWTDPGLLTAQRVRIIAADTSAGILRTTVDGRAITPEIMVLMKWDAVVEPGFVFVHDGDTYEVVYVNDDFTYQKQVEVTRLG